MKVNTRSFAVMVLAVYWGLIVLSMVTGIWDSAGAQEQTNGLLPNSTLPPSEIKGMMSVQEILDTYQINKETLYNYFKVPLTEPTNQPVRDVAHKYGFEVENIREFIERQFPEECDSCTDRSTCPEDLNLKALEKSAFL